MESRLEACTGPHGRWHKAVQDRPPPWLPLPKRPQLPQFAASWLLTCRTGIHPTVAEFEPEWLGGQTGGWDASRGTVRSIGFFPGPNGYLGVTIWPWVSPMPTWSVVNPQGPGFSTNNIEREEAATEPGAPSHHQYAHKNISKHAHKIMQIQYAVRMRFACVALAALRTATAHRVVEDEVPPTKIIIIRIIIFVASKSRL